MEGRVALSAVIAHPIVTAYVAHVQPVVAKPFDQIPITGQQTAGTGD